MKPQTKKYLWVLIANAVLLGAVLVIWSFSLTISVANGNAPDTKMPAPAPLSIKPIIQGSFENIEILNETRLLPSLSYIDEQGKTRNLSDLTGQWTVLNFWASWCPPCLVELPTLVKLSELYNDEKLRVMAISLDAASDAAAVSEMYAQRDIPAIARYWDNNGQMLSALALEFLPTTYVIHPNGTVFAILPGDVDWAGRDAITFIESLIHPEATAQSLPTSSGTSVNKSPTMP